MGRLDTDAPKVGGPAKGREEASSPSGLARGQPQHPDPEVYLITYPGPSGPIERVGQEPPGSKPAGRACNATLQTELRAGRVGDPEPTLAGWPG